VYLFGSSLSLLGWDQRTYMPRRGAQHRGEQTALLSGMAHDMAVDKRIGELLAAVEGSDLLKDPDSPAAANVREIRHAYDQETKIPKDLVEALSRARTAGYQAWVEARRASSFKLFLPHLEKLVGLERQKADALGWKNTRYDALLDTFEPGATAAQVESVLSPLGKELSDLVGRIVAAGRRPRAEIRDNDYPIAAQEALGRAAAAAIGFDFAAGRLDVTAHPFCSGIGPGDTRLTTRYNPRSFVESLFGVLHEAGHGLYDQGLKPRHYGTPMGDAVSLGIHESQSRMWENFVGRSRAFWRFFFPRAQRAFPAALRDVSLDEMYFAVNEAKPSFIRVEADEVTYNLHIILRFELERALIEGKLRAREAPGAWNERFRKLFGLTPPDDARGCLQDVHWSEGYFGYFPTYTLGNLYAAQFFAQARRELGDLDEQFARGKFRPLLLWLRTKIHSQGMRYRAARLCREVTGRALSARPLLEHLRAKFAPLYGL
jgi:carboxypeptidase Taq